MNKRLVRRLQNESYRTRLTWLTLHMAKLLFGRQPTSMPSWRPTPRAPSLLGTRSLVRVWRYLRSTREEQSDWVHAELSEGR